MFFEFTENMVKSGLKFILKLQHLFLDLVHQAARFFPFNPLTSFLDIDHSFDRCHTHLEKFIQVI